MAFDLVHQVFAQGKDIIQFVETLTEHFRHILMAKLGGNAVSFINLSEQLRARYETSASLYSKEQVLNILEDLIQAQNQIRFMPSCRIGLEAILLKILRSHQRIPVEFLVRRLAELEQASTSAPVKPSASLPSSSPAPPPPPKAPSVTPSMDIDPTPTSEDIGKKSKPGPVSSSKTALPPIPPPVSARSSGSEPAPKLSPKDQHRLDTVLQFAAVELEGTIHRKF